MPNLLEIKLYGNSILQKVTEPVEELTTEIKQLIEDMIYTMYDAEGAGIAAPQVGVSKRIFVYDQNHSEPSKRNPIVCINPEFIEYEGEKVIEEGCLSFPNIYEKVKRFEIVKIQYRDINWDLVTTEAKGMLAVIMQHEFDHLNGITFIDKLTPMRKMALGFRLNRICHKSNQMSADMSIVSAKDT